MSDTLDLIALGRQIEATKRTGDEAKAVAVAIAGLILHGGFLLGEHITVTVNWTDNEPDWPWRDHLAAMYERGTL